MVDDSAGDRVTQRTLTVLTLNTLGVPFVRDTRARLRAVAREVDRGDVDIVCLQEIQLSHYVSLLDQGLSRFPHVAFEPFLYAPKGGLLTFSRYAIHDTRYVLYTERGAWHTPAVADRLLHKGLLSTELEIEGHPVVVVNTHLTANYDGDWSPENRYARVEAIQLAHLARYVGSIPPDKTVIVSGDFNVPRHSWLYEDFLQATGLFDPLEGDTSPTYEPLVSLPSRYSQPLDHVLIRAPGADEVVATAELCFGTAVDLARDRIGRVSDHLGIEVRLRWLRDLEPAGRE